MPRALGIRLAAAVASSCSRVPALDAHVESWEYGHSDVRGCFWLAASRVERFWTLPDYHTFLDAASGGASHEEPPLGLGNIFFAVKASYSRAEMAMRMEKAWLSSTAFHIFIVDRLIEGLPEQVQVVVNDGKERHEEGSDRDMVSISRLMIWLHQTQDGAEIGSLPPSVRWVVILGDDVYVNLAHLYNFLARQTSVAHPVAFSHVLSDVDVYDLDIPCLDSGALILNRLAYERIGEAGSCKICPHVGSDAASLAYCGIVNSVPLVHVPAIHCHHHQMQLEDAALTAGPLAHGWIAAGGLSQSNLNLLDPQYRYHPYDNEFPDMRCRLPGSAEWNLQDLSDSVDFCLAEVHVREPFASVRMPASLGDGATLDLDSMADGSWASPPDQELELLVIDIDDAEPDWKSSRNALGMALIDAGHLDIRTASSNRWYVLRPSGNWIHLGEIRRFLSRLRFSGVSSMLSGRGVAFAFAPQAQELNLAASMVVDQVAALLLVNAKALTKKDSRGLASEMRALGIALVHTPLLVPDFAALPRGLHGVPNEAAVSGVWGLGRVHDSMRDDVETKVESRRFFRELLLENFQDWAQNEGSDKVASGQCSSFGQEQLLEARSWLKYLHNDDDHIKVVRAFRGGRREIRTLHAMYNSEASEGLPAEGALPDTLLIARDCV